jgi:hypothetical protein
VHRRPLAIVFVLAVGDYLLWNWSLGGSHDVLALISGLTLVLLVIALLWLVALSGARLLARIAQRQPARQTAGTAATRRTDTRRATPVRPGELAQQQPQQQGGEPASSSKLAA